MTDDENNLVPKKQSLFPVTPDDLLDNALQNLDEVQARAVSRKAADEVVRIAIEQRMAEHRSEAAHGEMRNLVENANLLDRRGGDYTVDSTFQTATGTTRVQIRRSKSTIAIAVAVGLVAFVLILLALLLRH